MLTPTGPSTIPGPRQRTRMPQPTSDAGSICVELARLGVVPQKEGRRRCRSKHVLCAKARVQNPPWNARKYHNARKTFGQQSSGTKYVVG